ncbi:MAG: hypothetical protein H0T43_03975, partial [Solirubrobacterales bacterium]|nr:hypothetical protein [Solirubrobacterales bacterium]
FWAPHWATDDAPGPRARTDIDPAAYADFAAAVARRYAGDFTPPAPPADAPPPAPSQDEELLDSLLGPGSPFRGSIGPRRAAAAQAPGPLPRVDQFALYNEPNHQALLLPQWSGQTPVSPQRYRQMVQAAYPAVKSVSPGAAVLIGNTSSTGGRRRGAGSVAPLEFVRELACVDSRFRPRTTPECNGFQAVPGDGFAHHPYSQNEKPSRRSSPRTERGDVRIADLPVLAHTLDRLVKLGRLAPGNRAIHLTEFGYETERVPGRPTISQATQARWLTWAEYLADRVPAVRSFAQFLLRDQAKAPQRVSDSTSRPFGEFSTGLLRSDGSEKIAARTFQAGLFAERRRGGRTLLYGRLRLGPGVKTIVVQRRVGRQAWRRVARVRADGRATFTRTVRHRGAARYRLTYPGARGRRAAGLPVTPVLAGR